MTSKAVIVLLTASDAKSTHMLKSPLKIVLGITIYISLVCNNVKYCLFSKTDIQNLNMQDKAKCSKVKYLLWNVVV